MKVVGKNKNEDGVLVLFLVVFFYEKGLYKCYFLMVLRCGGNKNRDREIVVYIGRGFLR